MERWIQTGEEKKKPSCEPKNPRAGERKTLSLPMDWFWILLTILMIVKKKNENKEGNEKLGNIQDLGDSSSSQYHVFKPFSLSSFDGRR